NRTAVSAAVILLGRKQWAIAEAGAKKLSDASPSEYHLLTHVSAPRVAPGIVDIGPRAAEAQPLRLFQHRLQIRGVVATIAAAVPGGFGQRQQPRPPPLN